MSTSKTGLRGHVDAALEYLTVMVPASTALVAAGDQVIARSRRGRAADSGASVLEVVVISAIVLAIVLTVGAILRTKIVDKANNLDLTTPGAT